MIISRYLIASAATLALWQLTLASATAAAPVIQNVVNAASLQTGIASGAWIAIVGSSLASSTRVWGTADFSGADLPQKLDDVQVTINGRAAYIDFISPGQINVLGPDDPTTGTVNVLVTNSQGTSNAFPATKQSVAPAFFAYPQLGSRFAVIQTGPNYQFVAPPGLLGSAVTTTTVAPGNNLTVYLTGLGPVTPAQPAGQLVQSSAPTANQVTVTIGGKPADVLFAGLLGVGLYQINVIVPAVLSGDAPIVVSVAGKQNSGSAYVPIQSYGDPSGQTSPQLAGCVTGQVDHITYSTALLYTGQTEDVSIGGTQLCPTCSIKAPIFPEFTARLERSLETRKSVQACYDKEGTIYQVTMNSK